MQYAKQHVFNQKSSKEKTILSSRLRTSSDEGHYNQLRNLYLCRSSFPWFLYFLIPTGAENTQHHKIGEALRSMTASTVSRPELNKFLLILNGFLLRQPTLTNLFSTISVTPASGWEWDTLWKILPHPLNSILSLHPLISPLETFTQLPHGQTTARQKLYQSSGRQTFYICIYIYIHKSIVFS